MSDNLNSDIPGDTPDDEAAFEGLLLEAETGNDVSQLKLGLYLLAKVQLLENAQDSDTALEAISWIIKSSRQGNIEATEKLKECLENKIGVNETNINDIAWCIKTSQLEKKSRFAASRLFHHICPFDGKSKSISKEEYNRRVSELANNKLERKLLEKAIKENVSEEDFVNRIMKQLQGKSGLTLNKLLQNDVEWTEYNQTSFTQKLIYYPGKTLTWMLDNIIETAGNQGMLWLRTLMPVHQAYMLVVLFIYNLISVDAILWLLPIISFYVSLFVIITCTMQMFYSRRKLKDVRALADMLEKFSETFILESAESAYTWSSLTPYISFFVALPSTIVSFHIADKTWIPCSELTFASFIITVGCWFALSDSYDKLATLSIILDNISTLPAIVARMPQIPVLYQTLYLISRASYAVELAPGFYLEFGIPSFAYLVIPAIFFRMAMKKSWQGTYQILVPHLVCFFWWRLVVIFYLQSTWIGLVRATIGWTAFIILLPFLVVVVCFWLIFYFGKIFSIANIFKIITTLVLLGGVAIFAYWSRGGFRFGNFSLDNKSAKTNVLLTFILLFSSIPLAYIVVPDDTGHVTNYLPFETYEKHCGKPRWQGASKAQAMVDCSHFAQLKINWTATVKQVIVKQIDNQAESFIAALPLYVANWLRCTYGEDYEEDCESIESEVRKETCLCNKLQNRKCHLRNINRHTFEILADAGDSFNVKIIATYPFTNAVLRLNTGDEILFRGFLGDNLGNDLPTVNLYNLQCTSCLVDEATVVQSKPWNLLLAIKYSVQAVWNFFFAPVFIFRQPEDY